MSSEKRVEKSPVSLLEEFCLKKHQPIQYNLTENAPDFECTVVAFNETKTGKGRSKKQAKQLAAQNLIKHLCQLEAFKFDLVFLKDGLGNSVVDKEEGSSTRVTAPKRKSITQPEPNYVGNLLEFCVKNVLPPATFEIECMGSGLKTQFHAKCRVNDVERLGTGHSKQQAKKLAAMEVLNALSNSNFKPLITSELKDGELPSKIVKSTEGKNVHGTLKDNGASPITISKDGLLTVKSNQVLINKFFEKFELTTISKGLLLLSNTAISTKKRIQVLCAEFNFEIETVPTADSHGQLHITQQGFDLEITGPQDQLYDEAVRFFMAKLNIREFVKT